MDAEHLTVEHHRGDGQLERQRHHAGEPVGDVVEVAGVDAHVVAAPVDLDAAAVELPLDRCPTGVAQRLGDVGGAGGQHRLDRVEHRQPHGFEGILPFSQRERGGAAQITRQHRGTADDRDRDVEGGGHAIGHHAGQRSLPELAGEEATEEVA